MPPSVTSSKTALTSSGRTSKPILSSLRRSELFDSLVALEQNRVGSRDCRRRCKAWTASGVALLPTGQNKKKPRSRSHSRITYTLGSSKGGGAEAPGRTMQAAAQVDQQSLEPA
jgi:hypothetical protein